jgi:hypothetical protein
VRRYVGWYAIVNMIPLASNSPIDAHFAITVKPEVTTSAW